MHKFYLLVSFLFLNLNSYAQDANRRFERNEEKLTNVIFDYFRQEYDSTVMVVGSSFLMPSDSLSFKQKNEYKIKISDPKQGYLEIFFKDKLLYKYQFWKNQLHGRGFVYYPFEERVALQGFFINSKLDGLVFVQNEDGEMVEVMEFKEGKYIKHIYHWLSRSKEDLKRRSKNRSDNPLRNDEVIVR